MRILHCQHSYFSFSLADFSCQQYLQKFFKIVGHRNLLLKSMHFWILGVSEFLNELFLVVVIFWENFGNSWPSCNTTMFSKGYIFSFLQSITLGLLICPCKTSELLLEVFYWTQMQLWQGCLCSWFRSRKQHSTKCESTLVFSHFRGMGNLFNCFFFVVCFVLDFQCFNWF